MNAMNMNVRLLSPELRPIAEKVLSGARISDEDAMVLYASQDLNGIGHMANVVRERINGNFATYIHNRYINYSNVCLLSCQFCAFGAKKREDHAFEMAAPEIVDLVRGALRQGITEIHMVGGLHPTLPGEWYLGLLRDLRIPTWSSRPSRLSKSDTWQTGFSRCRCATRFFY